MIRRRLLLTTSAMILIAASAPVIAQQKQPNVREEISGLEQVFAKQFADTLVAKNSLKYHVTVQSRDGKSTKPATIIDFQKRLVVTTADLEIGEANTVVVHLGADVTTPGKIVLQSRPDHLILIQVENIGKKPAAAISKAPETGSFVAGFDKTGKLKVGTVTSGVRPENKSFTANEKQALAAHWKRLNLKVSERRNGFPAVFETDLDLDADACGSPMFASNGSLAGIVISRAGHHATLIIPIERINALVSEI